MQISLDARTIPEIAAVLGSGMVAVLVTAVRGWKGPARIFTLFCLSAMFWKIFDFAYPELTDASWVNSASWVLGVLAIALSLHFLVSYLQADGGGGLGRPAARGVLACYLAAAVFMAAGAAGVLSGSRGWKTAVGVYLFTVMAVDIALMVGACLREDRREYRWALLGTLAFAAGAGAQMVNFFLQFTTANPQTYGMLGFVAFLAYDLLAAGFLQRREERLRILAELGIKEERLREANTRFRKLVDSTYDIVFTMDREGNITAIKTGGEVILGLPADELLGKGYLRFLSSEEAGKAMKALSRGLRGEKIKDFEVVLRNPAGDPIILQLTGTRLFQDEEAALVIARDVTEGRKMEEELRRRNRLLEEANRRLRELDTLKTELVGLVGHELRSPLTVIYSYAAALRDHWRKMTEERKMESVDHILRECHRLNRMVENILDMTRIESERLFLDVRPGDLASLLREVAGEMEVIPGARSVELRLPEEGLEVTADWDKIKQVAINLLDNAFRFSPPGSRVVVEARKDGGEAVVRVMDAGPGFPREDRERLFEKFTQVKSKGVEKGLGLGLYLVRTFVEAHGGRVWVEDGEGGIVAFSLPLGERAQASPSAGTRAAGSHAPSRPGAGFVEGERRRRGGAAD